MIMILIMITRYPFVDGFPVGHELVLHNMGYFLSHAS